jgi:hypothetical protein
MRLDRRRLALRGLPKFEVRHATAVPHDTQASDVKKRPDDNDGGRGSTKRAEKPPKLTSLLGPFVLRESHHVPL